MSQRGVALDHAASHLHGLVGGVVEHLDLQFFPRIFEPADRVDQAIDDVLLVEDGQLHGDARQTSSRNDPGFRDLVLAVLVIKVDQPVAVHSVNRQQDQHDEIGNQQRQVEGVGLIQALKGLVQKMLAKVRPQALGGKNQGQGQRGQPKK